MAIITGRQRKELREALLEAFPSVDEFKIVVADSLDTYLTKISSIDLPLEVLVFNTIEWAESSGRLSQLVLGALSAKPDNSRLRAVARNFEFPEATAGELERLTRSSVPFSNPTEWFGQSQRLQRAVCRIQVESTFATGFLVSPDVVITGNFVTDSFWDEASKAAAVKLMFDVQPGPDKGTYVGKEYRLHSTNWRVFKSFNSGLPFALLRLSELAVDGGARWGLNATERPLMEREPAFLLHHGMAGPLKLSIGTIVNPHRTGDLGNVSYKINTEGGSSGAPCFDSELKVIAMHVGADREVGIGVQIRTVLDCLRSNTISMFGL